MLTYNDGDQYGSHCGQENRKATIMITCKRNEFQVWLYTTLDYNLLSTRCHEKDNY